MKISILSPDLSQNCLGRAYLLAKILQRRYQVEIVGPVFGDGIWEPVADDKSIEYKSIKICGRFKPYWQIRKLANKIDGDVIYASKPLFTSFGVGILLKISRRKPLILDIEDWQSGFMKTAYKDLSIYNRFILWGFSAIQFYELRSYWNNILGDKLSYLADEITVSGNFLKDKFGGTIIWHGRDTKAFNPEKFDKNLIQDKYKIGKKKKIIMFLGTTRRHKGIEDLIKAVSTIEDQNTILLIVGIDDRDKYSKNLAKIAKEALNNRFKGFGLQPFKTIPDFLAMADIVVIPQKRNFATVGQVPAKVFDAMAMAKPIIATNVSDLPGILDACGWIVEPDNPEQLAKTIQHVLNNPKEAEKIGLKARQRCIEKYSWDSMEKTLVGIFEKYEHHKCQNNKEKYTCLT